VHMGATSVLSEVSRQFDAWGLELRYLKGRFPLSGSPGNQARVFGPQGVASPLPGPGLELEVLDQSLPDLAVSHHQLTA
jgi:hypothetical protein